MISEMMKSFTEPFILMQRHATPDGEGGFVTRWEEGIRFEAATAHDTTILAQQAEGQDTASTYTFLVAKNLPLAYPDVVKRVSDGETFQITSDAADKFTPTISRMNLAAVTAKKWRIPG